MNSIFLLGVFTVSLFVLELVYFRVATHFNILDKPNTRSMHQRLTIRGGGVIFYVAALAGGIYTHALNPYVIAGLTLVAAVGFADDVKSQSSILRFLIQAVGFLLVTYSLQVFLLPWWIVAIILLIAVGTINAYNFMDGINGITGGYSLVALTGLYYVNSFHVRFISGDFIVTLIVGLMVFNFFNFRKVARCFAGDVGSLSIGFAVIFLILKLILTTGNPIFVFFLAVYAADSLMTIGLRLSLKENILTPHRRHLFQEGIVYSGMSHLQMTGLFMVAQLVIDVVIIKALSQPPAFQYALTGTITVMLASAYVYFKRQFKQTPPQR